MKLRSILTVLLVLAGTGVCVRLGLWQISRLHEKQAMNASLRAALAAEAMPVGHPAPPFAQVEKRRIEVAGRFDETRQLLLGGRVQARLPGVEVITPLVLPGDSVAVLVDRGWLYAPDGTRAPVQEISEPAPRSVVGIARAIPHAPPGLPYLALARDTLRTVWSAHALDLDSMQARLPYALAPFLLVELPGRGVPGKPLRRAPQALDESVHVGYAIQWFLFGAILLGGSAALAWSKRRGRPPRGAPPPLEPLP